MSKKLKSSFFKSILILASGSLLAQLVMVVTAPILTRVFTVDQIGTYTYILSVTSIFMAVVNGRYDMAIVTERKEEYVYPLIKLALIIGFIISAIVTIGYYIYSRYISSSNEYSLYIVIFIFIILISYSINNVLTSYNNRKKEYKVMTSVYIVRTIYQNIGAIIMGLIGPSVFSLLFPYSLGQFMGINKQYKSLKPYFKKVMEAESSQMKVVLKMHYKQPIFSAPAIFVNSFSYSSISLFLEYLFGMAALGYYSISVRLLGLPLSIVSGNISKVFFEEASKEYNERSQYSNSLKKTFKFLVILAIPMVLSMIFFAPIICSIVFGDEWGIAGNYVAILAPMFGLKFIVTALSPALVVASKQKIELFLQNIFLIASIVSFIVTKITGNTVEFYMLVISLSFSIGYICYLIAIFKFSKSNIKIEEKS